MCNEWYTLERQEEVELKAQDATFRFFGNGFRATKHGFRKAIDATIFNTPPCGAPIDGMVRMDGEFAKDAVDATVLNKHPSGANVDHAVNLF